MRNYNFVIKNCPSCGVELIWIGVDLVCKNENCYDANVRKIAHFFKTMGSEYVTETTVRNLGVNSIEDMYNLDELEIGSIEGFGIKKAEQIYYEIQKTLKVTPDKLLAAFGITGIGKTLAPVILEKYTFDELFSIMDISDIEGVGDILSDNLVNNINNFTGLYNFLKEKGLEFVMKERSNISGLVFTLTGKMPMKRDVITRMITAKGGWVKGISKTTDYLVTDDTDSGSIKNQKAQKFGTKIIGFDELMDMIG